MIGSPSRARAADPIVGRGAVADSGDREALVDALVAVLAERYDSVEHGEDSVVVRERGFDPERARELGVPEGPAFGRLANGEAVDVDGTTVAPEDVLVDRVEAFPLR